MRRHRERIEEELDAWCRRWLASPPTSVIFQAGLLSSVWGVRLDDGRDVVIKVRPSSRRLIACHLVQERLHREGFPCPRPMVRPRPFHRWVATAEEYLAGGCHRSPHEADARSFAGLLADLVRLAPPPSRVPPLHPSPPWAGWDHPGRKLWPAEGAEDLNRHPDPPWLGTVATRVRSRLLRCRLPRRIGHGDWESHNLRWAGASIRAVDDWDSSLAQPEPAIAGHASVVFPSLEWGQFAGVASSAAFLEAYQEARGVRWDRETYQLAWAAGLWALAFKAKKEACGGWMGPVSTRLIEEADERMALAGLPPP